MGRYPLTGMYAWAHYRQYNGNPCDTRLKILTTTSATVSSWTGAWYADSFGPSIVGLSTVGLADYIGGAALWTSGDLFIAYGRPRASSGSCTACKGTNYSIALYGVRATP
ncbi:MAG TPA: hypothetical protein VGJ84_22110 [Polyangiaceae bacterium]